MSGYILNGKTGKTLKDLTFEKYKEEKSKTPKAFFKHYPNITSNDGRNYSQETLESEAVFFSDPQSFDDPYDCDFYIEDVALKKEVICRLVVAFNIEGSNYKSRNGLLEDVVNCILRNGYSRTGKEITYDFSCNPNAFIKANAIDIVSNNFEKSISEIAKRLDCRLTEMLREPLTVFKKLRVACFTDRNNSIPMWSFYSNSHKEF